MRQKTFDQAFAFVPSLYINDDLVRGTNRGDVAASAVCDSFDPVPETCKSLVLPSTIAGDENIYKMVLIALAVVGLIFFASIWIFKKIMSGQIEKDMEGMVNHHLERYHQMSAQDTTQEN